MGFFEELLLLQQSPKEINAMPLFSFELDILQITDTRSAHKDTDYSFTLKIGGADPQNVTKSMGNLIAL